MDYIERLRARRERINARIAKLAAAKQTHERREETRRKIIAGAVLLDAVQRDRLASKPQGISRWWDAQLERLSRSHDRELFGLGARNTERGAGE